MPVYTVHAPSIDGNARQAADRVVLIRDGFHIWAAVAGALWLTCHRLWLALLGYLVAIFSVVGALRLLRIDSEVSLVVMIVISVLMGFEAASLQRWTLSRGKWRQLDVVVAKDRETAERRFFDGWVEGRAASGDSGPTDRGAPPPLGRSPLTSGPHPESHGDVMGLFPQPGAPR
jgi:hypothetical protein